MYMTSPTTIFSMRIQPELFCALGSPEADNARDSFFVSTERAFGFRRCELGNLAFIDFFCFFYPETFVMRVVRTL